MDTSGGSGRLSLGPTYFPPGPSTFVGPSSVGSFTGTTALDAMVVAAGKSKANPKLNVWLELIGSVLNDRRGVLMGPEDRPTSPHAPREGLWR